MRILFPALIFHLQRSSTGSVFKMNSNLRKVRRKILVSDYINIPQPYSEFHKVWLDP